MNLKLIAKNGFAGIALTALFCTSVQASSLRAINSSLKNIESQSSDKIQVWLDGRERPDLIMGETFKFRASSSSNGYLTLFYVDQNGDSALMDVGPPAAQSEGQFNFTFPPRGTLPVESPIGRSLVYAYLTAQKPNLERLGLIDNRLLAPLENPKESSQQFAALIQENGPTLAKGRLSFFVQDSTEDNNSFKTRLISQILLADSSETTVNRATNTAAVIKATKPITALPAEDVLASAKASAMNNNTTFDVPVYFAYNSSDLTASSKQLLDGLSEGPLSDPRIRHNLMIVGHTDSSGSANYNMALSNKRAMAVKRYLVDSHGVKDARVFARGRGESEPAAPNSSASNRKLNRRVEFIFMLP